MAGVSLNSGQQLLFPPSGLSLRWYAELIVEPTWLNAMGNSLIIAFSSAALAVLIAFPLAWFVWRYRLGYGKLLYGLGVAPFTLPPVITALGFLVFWGERRSLRFDRRHDRQSRDLLRDPAAGDDQLGPERDRQRSDRGGPRTMGADEVTIFCDDRPATDPALCDLGLCIRIRTQPERVYRRLHGCRVHGRNACRSRSSTACATAIRR